MAMTRKSKTVVWVVTVAGAVGAGLVLATSSFEAPGLGKAVVREAREALEMNVEPSRSTFGLLDGLVLEEVTVSSDLALGRYQARLDAIRLEEVPLSLLKGRIELTRVVLERPRVVIALGGPVAPAVPGSQSGSFPPTPRARAEASESPETGEAAAASASPGPIGFDVVPSEVFLQEGSVAIRDERRGRVLWSLDGLQLDLATLTYDRHAITPLHALSSNGNISVAALTIGDLRFANVEAALSTESGRFRLDDLRVHHAHAGDLEGELDVDFNSIPFRYRISLIGSSMDLGRIGHLPSEGLGKGLVRLEANGFGTESRHLRATGSLELEPGRLPAVGWLSEIDPSLPGTEYDRTAVSFEVRDSRLSFDGLRLGSSRSSLLIAGSIDFDDDIELTVTARLGGKEFPYRLRGTLDQPRLSALPKPQD